MHMIELGLKLAGIVLLSVLGRAVFVYIRSYRTCRWCRPGGLLFGSILARMAGHEPRPRRGRRCWRCKGTRMTRRLGAKTVHKMKLAVQQAWEER
jgi:hypothetical protein